MPPKVDAISACQHPSCDVSGGRPQRHVGFGERAGGYPATVTVDGKQVVVRVCKTCYDRDARDKSPDLHPPLLTKYILPSSAWSVCGCRSVFVSWLAGTEVCVASIMLGNVCASQRVIASAWRATAMTQHKHGSTTMPRRIRAARCSFELACQPSPPLAMST